MSHHPIGPKPIGGPGGGEESGGGQGVEEEESGMSMEKVYSGFNIEFMDVVAYSLSYANRNSDLVWGVLVITISLVFIVCSITLNWFVFTFYLKKAGRDLVSMMYTLLSGCDIIVSLGGLLSVISLILYLSIDMEEEPRDKVYPAVSGFCISSFVISSISIRMSVALNALLSLVRTIMIKNPFAVIPKKGILILLSLIFIFWGLLIVGDVFALRDINIEIHWSKAFEARDDNNVTYDESILSTPKQNLYFWYYIFNSLAGYYHIIEFLSTRLPWALNLWAPPSSKIQIAELYLPYVMFVLAYFIATVVSLVCLVVQAVHLKKSQFSNEKNKEVTITIVLLTIAFVICNIASIIYITIEVETFEHNYDENGDPIASKDTAKIQEFYRGMFVFQQMVPLLNSALSPMILIWRGSRLKDYMLGRNEAMNNNNTVKSTT